MGAPAVAALLLCLPAGAFGATINVTTLSDETTGANNCSLREAISAANDNDTGPGGDCTAGDALVTDVISLPAGHYVLALDSPLDDVNAGGDLDIAGDLTIAGAGAASTSVDANGLDRVFDIQPSSTVELRDVTVMGGQTQAGDDGDAGGDHSAGGASTGTNGLQGEDGGGIRNQAGLTLTRVVVTGNHAGDGGIGGNGGPAGTATPGDPSTGGTGGFGGNGGGIMSGGALTLVDSHVTLNSAGNGGLGGPGGLGGTGTPGAAATGGYSQGGDGGFGGEGGGISAPSGSLTITNSLIDFNTAGTGGVSGQGGTGGTGGSAAGGGGAGGTSFGGNGRFGGFGGGIAAAQTAVQITGSVIRSNSSGDGGLGGPGGTGGAGGAGSSVGPGGDTQGGNGGIAGPEAGMGVFNGSLSITATTISGNTSGKGGNGGPGGTASGTSNADAAGGSGGSGGSSAGLDVQQAGAATVLNVTIADNHAGAGGSGGAGGTGLTSTGGAGGQGGSNAGVFQAGAGSLTIRQSTVASNATGAGGAGGLPGGTAGISGVIGGVAEFLGDITLRSSIVANNGADQCSGAITDGGQNVAFPGDDSDCAAGLHGDPLLGPLQGNGGPVFTMLPAPGSPAIGAVANDFHCAAADARGIARPKGALCDAGAVEVSPPAATTGSASAITTAGATLAGAVTPGELATTYRFQYGTTTAYGTQTPVANAGSSASSGPVSADISGLEPNTTYHFRLVATNGDGAANGEDGTFTTQPVPVVTPPPPGLTPPAAFGGVKILTKTLRIDAKGRAAIKISCPAGTAGACTGKLSLKTKKGAGSKTFTIAPGKTATIRVKLSKAARATLVKKRKLKLTLTATAHDANGSARTVTGKLTVKPAKRKA